MCQPQRGDKVSAAAPKLNRSAVSVSHSGVLDSQPLCLVGRS